MIGNRTTPAGAALVIGLAGLTVHTAPSWPWADKLGDALYAGLVFTLLWCIAPRTRPRTLAAIALAWCVAVELLQLTSAPQAVANQFPLARLVLGSGFDARDLVAYATGVALGLMVHRVARRGRSRSGSS